jgi:hypothetical protein
LRKCRLVNEVSLTINEEEKIMDLLDNLIKNYHAAEKGDMAFVALNEELSFSFSENVEFSKSLIYPCVKIIDSIELPVSSGLQYEAVIKLGALSDPRAMDSLIAALERIDIQHADMHAALIYAIGNLRQKSAADVIKKSLEVPDYVEVNRGNGGKGYKISLNRVKAEAIWALGKLCVDSEEIVQALCELSGNSDNEVKLYLAWALGMIGKQQFERYGGVSVEVVITLMKLLADSNVRIFEEAALALKRIGLSDLLNLLHLRNITFLSVLTLKPSSHGLVELSETLRYLLNLKQPVVMAITGDSGTGKTYFCDSIIGGFGDIKPEDILYLARDKPEHNKIFNRILGLKWLKKYVSPQFYSDYPLKEEDDNPQEYFYQFINDHSNKKLIILDGWRDLGYFHQVIQTFYENGYLDVLVKFQASYSTKRKNLEERERILYNVKLCLGNIEDPIIEETPIYREGRVLLYYLDNSEHSRLNKEETLEVFEKVRVKAWGDYIRIGDFIKNVKSITIEKDCVRCWSKELESIENKIEYGDVKHINVRESKFSRRLNEDLDKEPNLLQLIELKDYDVNKISFYLPGRIMYGGAGGSIGIFSSINDRAFIVNAHSDKVINIDVLGEDIVSLDCKHNLKKTSFANKTIIELGDEENLICSIASDKRSKLIAGLMNGDICIWDFELNRKRRVKLDDKPVILVSAYQSGLIVASDGNKIKILNYNRNTCETIEENGCIIAALAIADRNHIIAGLKCQIKNEVIIKLINIENYICNIVNLEDLERVNAINVYFDGRIILGGSSKEDGKGNLVILEMKSDECLVKKLSGHDKGTIDCITMGPRIITFGKNKELEPELKIWGTDSYVKVEHSKLKITEGLGKKPPYYWTIF